jgi:SHS2 domain-containing protein
VIDIPSVRLSELLVPNERQKGEIEISRMRRACLHRKAWYCLSPEKNVVRVEGSTVDNGDTPRYGPSMEMEERIQAAIDARQSCQRVEGKGSVPNNYDNIVETSDSVSGERHFEYLDHTADVQLHSWGANFQEALEHLAKGIFGVITTLERIENNPDDSKNFGENIKASANNDINGLVHAFLNEWLYVFFDTGFVARNVTILELTKQQQPATSGDSEEDIFFVRSRGDGGVFDLRKHPQGTEVKAITYSNMQIKERDDRCDIWVIVDISVR